MKKLGTILHYATPRFDFLFSLSYERNMQEQIDELNEKLKLKEKNSHVSGFLGILLIRNQLKKNRVRDEPLYLTG